MTALGSIAYDRRSAAENMALDQWMVAQLDASMPVMFRSYGWLKDAITYGYTQKIQQVKLRFSEWEWDKMDCCRRPTAGGIVDHRNDWTFALAMHASFSVAQLKPLQIYRSVHEILLAALTEIGARVELYIPEDAESSPEACFDRPSPFDVLLQDSGLKVAGAAMKRTRSGLLIQGSVSRERLPSVDFKQLHSSWESEFLKGQRGSCEETLRISPPDVIPNVEVFRSPEWSFKR